MEKETRPFISWQLADDFMTAVFEKMGVPTEDARLCADVLLESDRRGIESHGCNRFKPIYIDRIKSGILNPVTKIDILKETPTTAVLDANDGMGMVASKKAMDMCIEKAHKYGMGMVAVRNSSHYGIAGYWTGLAAKENMIGISGTNARPSVAPTFGVENMLGTNPLTFSMPTDEPFPFTLDCATSVIQNGKIEYYARINHDTPKGLVISREGEELTDSAEILKKIRSQQAALAPLGSLLGASQVSQDITACFLECLCTHKCLCVDSNKEMSKMIWTDLSFLILTIQSFQEETGLKSSGKDLNNSRVSVSLISSGCLTKSDIWC